MLNKKEIDARIRKAQNADPRDQEALDRLEPYFARLVKLEAVQQKKLEC